MQALACMVDYLGTGGHIILLPRVSADVSDEIA